MRITIGTKIVVGLLTLLLLMLGLSLYLSVEVRRSMEHSVGDSSILLADEVLRRINRDIYAKIEGVQTYAYTPVPRGFVIDSNREFDAIGDVESFLAKRDKEWKEAGPGEITPLMRELSENDLSRRIRNLFIRFYEQKYGYRLWVQTSVTNKYGATIALTDITPAYRQDGQTWWKTARDEGVFVGGIRYDNLSRTNVVEIAARIDDADGNFIGVIFGTIDILGVVRDAEISSKQYLSTEIKLVTEDGRLIYSTEAFKPLDEYSKKDPFTKAVGNSGAFIAKEGGRERLFAYAHSNPYRDFAGLDVILLVSHDLDEVLKPTNVLQRQLQAASLVVFILGIFAAALLALSITRPIGRLKQVVENIDMGHLDADIDPKLLTRTDELGEFALSFSRMAANLKRAGEEILLHAEASRKSEQLLRAYVNAITESMLLIDAEGTVVAANETACRTFRKPMDQVVGADLYHQLPAKSARLMRSHIDAVTANGNPVTFEDAHHGRYILNSIYPVFDPRGGVERLSIFRYDITDLRQTQEALRLAGIYNRSLIEASIDPLVTIGPDGRITDVNAATEAATGCTRTELIGTDFADYFTNPMSARTGYQQVFREGAVHDYPLEIRHTSGGVTPVLYNATIYRDESGKTIGVFAAARDITDIRKSEERIRESEQTLRAYINATTESMMLIDTEGRVIDANETVCRRLNTTREKLLGSILFDFLGGDAARERRRHVDEVIMERRPVVFEDLRQGRYILNTMNPVLDTEGKVAKIAVFGYDVTDLKREKELRELYEQLARFADDLKRSNRDLEQFAYVASHDLQEPLRIVSSYAQLLGTRYEGKLGADADDFIKYLVDGAARMQRLIDDLLTFSRVGTRGKPFMPTDCAAAVSQAIDNLAFAVEESGAKITVDPLPIVDGDPSQLVQLFQNMIGNAIKFRGENSPRVHICARRKEDEWVFSIKDNGIGIAPEYKDRIFVIFQRLHATDRYPGTGIGLAIAKKIVERHGGAIWVDSQIDEGATFCFTIPDHGGKNSEQSIDDQSDRDPLGGG